MEGLGFEAGLVERTADECEFWLRVEAQGRERAGEGLMRMLERRGVCSAKLLESPLEENGNCGRAVDLCLRGRWRGQ